MSNNVDVVIETPKGSAQNSFPGVIIKCRIIGGIKSEQSEEKGSKKNNAS